MTTEEIRAYQSVAFRMAEFDIKTGKATYQWWYRMYEMLIHFETLQYKEEAEQFEPERY